MRSLPAGANISRSFAAAATLDAETTIAIATARRRPMRSSFMFVLPLSRFREAVSLSKCARQRSEDTMKLPRRNFLRWAAGALALPALSRAASALDYPTRPVRIVVGFPAGGGQDILAR